MAGVWDGRISLSLVSSGIVRWLSERCATPKLGGDQASEWSQWICREDIVDERRRRSWALAARQPALAEVIRLTVSEHRHNGQQVAAEHRRRHPTRHDSMQSKYTINY